MEIAFVGPDGARTALVYDKVLYEVEGDRKGLRYGENPDQLPPSTSPSAATWPWAKPSSSSRARASCPRPSSSSSGSTPARPT